MDITNQIFYTWKVTQQAERPEHISSKSGNLWWLCECIQCGAQKVLCGSQLRNGKVGKCKCLSSTKVKRIQQSKPINTKIKNTYPKIISENGGFIKDETGNKYGKLTVLQLAYTKNSKAYWTCQCECGNTTIASGAGLRDSQIHSCGCLSSYKEYEISQILKQSNILFQAQFSFEDLTDIKPLRFDFAILNTKKEVLGLIEYQGRQHYDENNFFHCESLKLHDQMKVEYCTANDIPLLLLNKDNFSQDYLLDWINNLKI